jgi:hypothetical protein
VELYSTDKTLKIQNSVKTGKTGCVCVVECSLYASCNKNTGRFIMFSIITNIYYLPFGCGTA